MYAVSIGIIMMLWETAVFDQLQAAATTVICALPAGLRTNDEVCVSAVVPIVPCIADLAVPIPIAGMVFILMLALAFCNHLFTNRTSLIVFRLVMIPAAVQLVSFCGTVLFLIRLANSTENLSCSRLCTGCGITSLYFFPQMPFHGIANRTSMFLIGTCPVMHFGISDRSSAILAEQDMGTVSKIPANLVLMGTVFHQSAATTYITDGAICVFNILHLVVNIVASVKRRYAVTDTVSITLCAAAYIPAIGQGIAQCQHISVFQIVF